MQERMIFVISPPRAGSTLLQRMLGSHAAVFTHPEPHLVTPLAYLGYHDRVDRAPYDHINAAEAIRQYVERLPRGEEDYLDALRAYADTLYGRMIAKSGKERFLDKTPAYALVLPFLTKLYPKARYIVLTRHPLAVFSSYANSFFEGDWRRAHEFNPLLERYVPAMAKLIREQAVPVVRVRYEELVAAPERELERLFSFLGLPHDPGAVEYGNRFEAQAGRGDPMKVAKHSRPVTDSVEKWTAELDRDEDKLTLAREMCGRLDPADLETWGYPEASLFEPLGKAGSVEPPRRVLNNFTFQRRIFLALKKDIRNRPHGKLVERVRYYCDVLLRE